MEETSAINVDEVEGENTQILTNTEPADVSTNSEKHKFVRLPLARVKHIMKTDPDCCLISHDALFLVTKSAELFLEHLSRESSKFMALSKRKTVQRKDVDAAIDNVPSLCFLDGALE